jgi:hypothetical protein
MGSNKNSIDPKIWGNDAWNYFHYVIFGYPDNPSNTDKYNYMNWCRMFAETLPCGTCRDSFKTMIDRPPLMLTNSIMESRNSFIKWGWMVHNQTDKHTGSSQTLSYEAFLEKYSGLGVNILTKRGVSSSDQQNPSHSTHHHSKHSRSHSQSNLQSIQQSNPKPYKCATCGKK